MFYFKLIKKFKSNSQAGLTIVEILLSILMVSIVFVGVSSMSAYILSLNRGQNIGVTINESVNAIRMMALKLEVIRQSAKFNLDPNGLYPDYTNGIVKGALTNCLPTEPSEVGATCTVNQDGYLFNLVPAPSTEPNPDNYILAGKNVFLDAQGKKCAPSAGPVECPLYAETYFIPFCLNFDSTCAKAASGAVRFKVGPREGSNLKAQTAEGKIFIVLQKNAQITRVFNQKGEEQQFNNAGILSFEKFLGIEGQAGKPYGLIFEVAIGGNSSISKMRLQMRKIAGLSASGLKDDTIPTTGWSAWEDVANPNGSSTWDITLASTQPGELVKFGTPYSNNDFWRFGAHVWELFNSQTSAMAKRFHYQIESGSIVPPEFKSGFYQFKVLLFEGTATTATYEASNYVTVRIFPKTEIVAENNMVLNSSYQNSQIESSFNYNDASNYYLWDEDTTYLKSSTSSTKYPLSSFFSKKPIVVKRECSSESRTKAFNFYLANDEGLDSNQVNVEIHNDTTGSIIKTFSNTNAAAEDNISLATWGADATIKKLTVDFPTDTTIQRSTSNQLAKYITQTPDGKNVYKFVMDYFNNVSIKITSGNASSSQSIDPTKQIVNSKYKFHFYFSEDSPFIFVDRQPGSQIRTGEIQDLEAYYQTNSCCPATTFPTQASWTFHTSNSLVGGGMEYCSQVDSSLRPQFVQLYPVGANISPGQTASEVFTTSFDAETCETNPNGLSNVNRCMTKINVNGVKGEPSNFKPLTNGSYGSFMYTTQVSALTAPAGSQQSCYDSNSNPFSPINYHSYSCKTSTGTTYYTSTNYSFTNQTDKKYVRVPAIPKIMFAETESIFLNFPDYSSAPYSNPNYSSTMIKTLGSAGGPTRKIWIKIEFPPTQEVELTLNTAIDGSGTQKSVNCAVENLVDFNASTFTPPSTVATGNTLRFPAVTATTPSPSEPRYGYCEINAGYSGKLYIIPTSSVVAMPGVAINSTHVAMISNDVNDNNHTTCDAKNLVDPTNVGAPLTVATSKTMNKSPYGYLDESAKTNYLENDSYNNSWSAGSTKYLRCYDAFDNSKAYWPSTLVTPPILGQDKLHEITMKNYFYGRKCSTTTFLNSIGLSSSLCLTTQTSNLTLNLGFQTYYFPETAGTFDFNSENRPKLFVVFNGTTSLKQPRFRFRYNCDNTVAAQFVDNGTSVSVSPNCPNGQDLSVSTNWENVTDKFCPGMQFSKASVQAASLWGNVTPGGAVIANSFADYGDYRDQGPPYTYAFMCSYGRWNILSKDNASPP